MRRVNTLCTAKMSPTAVYRCGAEAVWAIIPDDGELDTGKAVLSCGIHLNRQINAVYDRPVMVVRLEQQE